METNAYGAEFGRNSGGQIHVVTKSGSNDFHGSVYEYHRNDALDARNFFDAEREARLHAATSSAAPSAGPIRKDRTFFFVGSRACASDLGRTISTVVPDDAARGGVLPDPRDPGRRSTIPVTSAVAAVPRRATRSPTAPTSAAASRPTRSRSTRRSTSTTSRSRLDQNVGAQDQLFVRYTFDDAEQLLPTDFPQFPRTFLSTQPVR